MRAFLFQGAGVLEIATMTRPEMAFAIDLAAAEGWNPGLCDAGAFHHADPEGFFIARLGGEPVGCISAVSYPGRFGFIGLFIVVPACRGQGIGGALWRRAMAYLADHVVGLDGVVAQQDNYRRAGFTRHYRNVRFVAPHAPRGHAHSFSAIDASLRPALDAYDRQCFAAPRQRFLDAWLSMDGSRALACVDGERLSGYGVARACREGVKIGPLFADHAGLAQQLFEALCDDVEGPVCLDVPDVNTAGLALAERNGMQAVFETARMYRGEPAAVRTERIFGVTTFELG